MRQWEREWVRHEKNMYLWIEDKGGHITFIFHRSVWFLFVLLIKITLTHYSNHYQQTEIFINRSICRFLLKNNTIFVIENLYFFRFHSCEVCFVQKSFQEQNFTNPEDELSISQKYIWFQGSIELLCVCV